MAKKKSSPKANKPAAKKTASKKKSKAGIRYSIEQKAEIIQFVQEHGRGGQTAASKKFGVSPLTISKWLKKGRGAAPKKKVGRKAAKKSAAAVPKTTTATLQRMIVIQGELEALQSEFEELKAGL